MNWRFALLVMLDNEFLKHLSTKVDNCIDAAMEFDPKLALW